ncbi:MAG: hypothetical protein AB8I08_05605 [Sandaracinaceae bacterium]
MSSPHRLVVLFAVWIAACGSDPTPSVDPAPAPLTVRGARFGTELEGQQVRYPVPRFTPEGPFRVSLELSGAPTGALSLSWTWEGRLESADVSLEDAEVDGDAAHIAAELSVPSLPIGVHQLVVQQEGEELARFPFEVGPPEGALPSRIESAQTARGATVDFHPIDATDAFGTGDAVFLTGCGDFGRATWIGVEWRVADEVDEDGTQRITLDADASDTCFAFDFRPHVGWPAGEHEAVLLMNAREIGRYSFRVE